jgi:hypothetical protein
MYSRTVDQLIDGLKGRFFATPFEIAILPALAQTFHPDDRVHTVTQYEKWRIYRSAHSYCLPTSHLHHQETLVIEGLDTTKVDKLLPPLLVIEYDLRIMRRNLCDLIDLGGTVRTTSARLETHIEEYVRKAEPVSGSLYANLTYTNRLAKLLKDVERLRRSVTTLASDIFTAALDLENYVIDITEVLGLIDLCEFYRWQAETCYVKAKLLLAPVDTMLERLQYIMNLMNVGARVGAID